MALKDKIKRHIYKLFYKYTYKYSYRRITKLHVNSIDNTIDELVNTNRSLSRFGDGEFRWLLCDNHDSFERSSRTLSRLLKKVILCNDTNLMIGLPDSFISIDQFTNRASNFWKLFFAEYGTNILPYLNSNKWYYNTSISRVYMDYRDKSLSGYYFKNLKRIWNDKKILIVEGTESRLGVNDGLFNNAKRIRRIECPPINAFESIHEIFDSILSFLKNSHNYITLLALGPTATILSYWMFNNGYRAIDIGHIDIEYDWYLMGATKKVNIKDKYVNEVKFGRNASNVNNKDYMNQIIKIIK